MKVPEEVGVPCVTVPEEVGVPCVAVPEQGHNLVAVVAVPQLLPFPATFPISRNF